MRHRQFILLAVGVTLAAIPAAAQEDKAARSLAANCSACHGAEGKSVGGNIPGLAGQNKEYLVQQMKDFKEGKRQATIMHQIAKGYSDAEIAAMAAYFAAQKK